MAKKAYFIKLDHDWMKDKKVRNIGHLGGKAALLNVVQLFIVLSRNSGRLDWNDFGERADAVDFMNMSEKKLESFLDLAAECELIDPELWQQLRVATSQRARDDSDLSSKRSEAGRAGGEASGKAKAAAT